MRLILRCYASLIALQVAVWLANTNAQTCGDPVIVACPTPLAAAQTLTANSTFLPISNASFTGGAACSVSTKSVGLVIIDSFALNNGTKPCHHLATTMATGAVVLSNGDGRIAAYTNNSVCCTGSTGGVNTKQNAATASTDSDAAKLSTAMGYTQAQYDVNFLSFSITPTVSGPLTFSYMFGSEEYEQYASPGSKYNDFFGFLIWKDSDVNKTNVALIPNTSVAVSISTVNQNVTHSYNAYYNSNIAKTRKTELNGLTTLLTTREYNASAGTKYNIKLLIADGFDASFDSLVWIAAGSIAFKVDCQGSWGAWGACNATCGGGYNFSTYSVSVNKSGSGVSCPAAHGQVRNQTCNTQPCPVDCVGGWGAWGSCNQTCGGGYQSAKYTVTTAAAYGGVQCPFTNGTMQQQTCNTQACPVNCTGAWSVWGSCNQTCGTGYQFSTYAIMTPASGGGANCQAANGTIRNQTCNTQACPVNCTGTWSVWGSCNQTCGTGYQFSTYAITTPASGGGANCQAANGTIRNQTCNTQACPVNCTGAWSVWDSCNQSCGTGYQFSTYAITTPASGGGANCQAANGTIRNQTCNTQACPVNCTGAWGAWSACNATCGGGYQFSTYSVTVSATGGGADCAEMDGAVQNLTCNTHACPVDCVGSWTAWSACGPSCGSGYQLSTYSSTTPASHGGTACEAADGAVRNQTCSTPCPGDCIGSWAAWDVCNATCGGGYQSSEYTVATPANGGIDCEAANGTIRNQTCNTQACPVNCTGTWSVWGSCNQTCGAGYQLSTYAITTPASGGGANCQAANGTIRNQTCNTQACPVNCTGTWSVWGSCNQTCGTGYQFSTYAITTPASGGGADCEAANGTIRNQTCNTHACPVNCVGSWTAWSACGPSCGSGYQLSTYSSTTPASHGGTACEAADGAVRNQTCSTPCPGDCIGSWAGWEACNATCGGGYQSSEYTVATPASGGIDCEAANGTIRNRTCNTQPCPVNCTGAWGAWSACNATCGGGYQFSTYSVTVSATGGGADCAEMDGTVQNLTCNTHACPVDCVGSWTAWSACGPSCGSGYQLSTYSSTTPASYGGTACEAADGAVRNQTCSTPCPGDCIGSWAAWDVCNATCGGGYQSSEYTVATPASGGIDCEAANGTIRNQTCNTQACPVNCTGAWGAWSACNATCGGGYQSSEYIVTTPASAGIDCEAANGTIRNQTCNTHACPVDCVGSWTAWSACGPSCGSGYQLSTYSSTTPASHGGTACEAADGAERNQTCSTPCPGDCIGSWAAWDVCNATCGGGYQSSEYTVATPANGGIDCEAANGTIRNRTCNTQACPVNCVGSWGDWNDCSQLCGGGMRYSMYTISIPASLGGAACEADSGAWRNESCNTAACPASVDPTGLDSPSPPMLPLPSESPWSSPSLMASPSPSPKLPPSPSPKPLPSPVPMNTTTPAEPVSSLPDLPPFVWSPPVLPPIPNVMADSGIVIRGGNVSISGVKIDASSGYQAVGDAAGSLTVNSLSLGTNNTLVSASNNNTNGSVSAAILPAPKPRRAAFNGSLGFYTLGLRLEVIGDFVLQRSMAWTYNNTYDCYTTAVYLRGRFLLIRDEVLDGVVGGELELDPSPFIVWADAGVLLANQSSNVSSHGSKHLTPFASSSSSKHSRALRQSNSSTSTGMVPVQGRVSVRESGSANGNYSSNSSTGALPLDAEADIVVMGPVPAASSPSQGNSSGRVLALPEPAVAASAPLPAWHVPNYNRLIVVLAAVVAPVAVALCAVCCAAGILYRRKRREEEEEKLQERAAANAAKHAAGINQQAPPEESISASGSNKTKVTNSKLRRRWSSAAGSSSDSTSEAGSIASAHTASQSIRGRPKSRPGNAKRRPNETPSAAPTPAELQHSSNGSLSESLSGQALAGDATITRIEFLDLDPDEPSGGPLSEDGTQQLHITHAPRRGGEDRCASFEPSSGPVRPQSRLESWAGSLAGMATNVTAALSSPFRSSHAVYKVSSSTNAQLEAKRKPAGVARRDNLDIVSLSGGQPAMLTSLDMPRGQREPTLPGARPGSVILAPGTAAALARQLAAATSPAAAGAAQQGARQATQQQLQQTPVKHLTPPHVINNPAAWGLPAGEVCVPHAAAPAAAGAEVAPRSIYSSDMYHNLLRQQQQRAGSPRQPPTWN